MSKMREEIARNDCFLYIIHHFGAKIIHFFYFLKHVQPYRKKTTFISSRYKTPLFLTLWKESLKIIKLQEERCMNFKHIHTIFIIHKVSRLHRYLNMSRSHRWTVHTIKKYLGYKKWYKKTCKFTVVFIAFVPNRHLE